MSLKNITYFMYGCFLDVCVPCSTHQKRLSYPLELELQSHCVGADNQAQNGFYSCDLSVQQVLIKTHFAGFNGDIKSTDERKCRSLE